MTYYGSFMKKHFDTKLSESDFTKIANFVYEQAGIKLPPVKRPMVEGRLRKRLKVCHFYCFKQYTQFVLSKKGQEEVVYMIDSLTTNKTDFFREIVHFDYLTHHLLPKLTAQGIGKNRPLRVWSAGCSSGQEPYTMAMVLEEWNRNNPTIDYSIFASDISTSVLKKAKQALYNMSDITPVPLMMRERYILKSDRDSSVIKMARNLRKRITFNRLNFKDQRYALPHSMDIIFCRNVMIYFDGPTQEAIINRFCDNLTAHGHLFIGHSETINGLNVPLSMVGSTIYQKDK